MLSVHFISKGGNLLSIILIKFMELETWRSERRKVNIQPGRRKEQEKVQVPGATAKAELLEHR